MASRSLGTMSSPLPENGDGFPFSFEDNPHPMYVYDPGSLKFLAVNDAALKNYGYSRQEFRRLLLTDIRPHEEVGRLTERIRNSNGHAGPRIEGTWRHRCKDGSLLEVDVTTHPIEFKGRPAVLAVAQDVTPQRQAEEVVQQAEVKYRTLVENLPAVTYVAEYGPDGRWFYVSPQIQEFLGFTAEEWLQDPRIFLQQIVPEDRERILHEEIRSQQTRTPFDWEYRMHTRAGKMVWIRDRGKMLQAGKNDVPTMHGVMVDITASKETQAELMRVSRHSDLILDSIAEGIFGLTSDKKLAFANPAAERMLGYGPGGLAGKDGHATWHHTRGDGRPYPKEECPVLAVLRDRQPRQSSDEVFWRKDGSCFPVEVQSSPIMEKNRVVGAVVTFRDITQRKQNEAARRRAEEKYRAIFENAMEGLFQTTPDGRFLSANPAIARMLGYSSPAELMSAPGDAVARTHVNPQRRHEFRRIIEERGHAEGFEAQVYCKNGSKVWLSLNVRVVRDAAGFVVYYEGSAQDITSAKRAELQRQVSHEIIQGVNTTRNLDELLHLIHECLGKVVRAENCYVALYDAEKQCFTFPFHADQFDSAPPPQPAGRSCTDYVLREGRPMLIRQRLFDDLVARGEVELVGTPSPAWLGIPLRTPSETIGVLVVQDYRDENAFDEQDVEFLDVVGGQIALAIDRKRAEDALRENEARLRVVTDQLPAILWTTDGNLRLTSAMGSGLARLGLSQGDLKSDFLPNYFNRDEKQPAVMAHQRALEGESTTYTADLPHRHYACHTEPLRDSQGALAGVIGIAFDITERKELEEQLRQAQKMEAIGRLAGGVAHDFNNLLMVIQGYTELLMDGLEAHDALRPSAEQIRDAATRAVSLTRQLLAFSRKQVLLTEVLNMGTILEDLLSILRRMAGNNATMDVETATDLWNVRADRSQIEQIFMNLVVNARDAMPRGGTIRIELENVRISDATPDEPDGPEPGDYVRITFRDTGCGMDAETKARAFEPFFTTKEKSRGTGLGLATVYGVVRQSGGSMTLESAPGEGACFRIYLPRVDGDAPQRKTPEFRNPREDTKGAETILLVEDEDPLREMTRDFLARSGYRILEAESAERAMEICRSHAGAIHLLLSDVMMPGMSGRELSLQVRTLRPGMKTLLMSGFAGNELGENTAQRSTRVIQKPVALSALAARIRELLNEKAKTAGRLEEVSQVS
jgi:two-component system, cell cycle sensor histidine kinase and response regulator CckA